MDGIVEEAVPLEQAGRSLVHWWHLRGFRDVMEGRGEGEEKVKGKKRRDGEEKGEEGEQEYNFFARELEKMGWGLGAGGGGGVDEEDGADGGEDAGNEFEGGPLQMEGWA